MILFLAGLFSSLVAHWLYGDAVLAVRRELRRPAPKPAWSWELRGLAKFPASYEAWHADTFGLRDQLVRWHNLEKLFVFHTAPVARLFLGERGWIFFTEERSRENWRGLLPFDEIEKLEWKRVLEARRDWCARRGIAYLFAIAPNKETIYPDYLPSSETKHGPTRREFFFPWMREHSDVALCDLAESLQAERTHDRLEQQDFVFNPLGTHWTDRGAWAGAEALAAELARRFPAMQPGRREDRQSTLREGTQDSWALSLLCEDILTEPIWGYSPRAGTSAQSVTPLGDESTGAERAYVTSHGELPSLLMLHDSFGPAAETPLAEHFSRMVTLSQTEALEQRVRLDRPAILLEMYTERRLAHWPLTDLQGELRLKSGEFDKLQRARPELDSQALLAAIDPVGGTTLQRDEKRRELLVVTASNADRLLLPEADPPDGHSLCLRLSVVAPEETVLSFWYQIKDDPHYRDERKLTMHLDAGPRTLIVRLFAPGLRGRVLVQPGWSLGRYVLRDLDLRW